MAHIIRGLTLSASGILHSCAACSRFWPISAHVLRQFSSHAKEAVRRVGVASAHFQGPYIREFPLSTTRA